jgi:stage II sporulation protein D
MNLSKKILFFILIFSLQHLFSDVYFVKVGIKTDLKKFYLAPYKKEEIFLQLKTKEIKKIKITQQTVCVFVPPNKIRLLGKIYELPIKLYSEGKVKINGNIYPGEIEVFSKNGKTVSLLNILDVETYLYGVLPYEIEPSRVEEMLKVQAIIARTYTIVNLNRHKDEGFDLCSTVHCQVYKGINENMALRIKKAVDSTKGFVVVDEKNGDLVITYYHAACGGATENVSEIWPKVKNVKTLSGVKCDFCKNSPYYEWKYSFDIEKFVIKLKVNGYNIGDKIKNILVLSKTNHGRIKNLQIVGNKNTVEISGETLRRIFGYNNLKSTKIYKIEVKNNKIYFYGKGWGHGVGLCQWGAHELIKQGKSFKEVIEYYYPKAKIKKLY